VVKAGRLYAPKYYSVLYVTITDDSIGSKLTDD